MITRPPDKGRRVEGRNKKRKSGEKGGIISFFFFFEGNFVTQSKHCFTSMFQVPITAEPPKFTYCLV